MNAQNQDYIHNYYHIYDMKLGEGGFAKVRLATHLLTRQLVAVKCLDKVKLESELPRIYNEIECLKKLKHNHIAKLLQVFETATHIYLILEHCSGGELFDYIVRKQRLEEPESAQVIYDLMRVLDYIHSNGFAHRDIKPENILFDDRKQIKLIDFGLAANCTQENMAKNRSQQPIDQLRTCCGSVTYAAPEVISGDAYNGRAVDVWSAGVMLYAMLVGQVPFNDPSIPKLYSKIRQGISTLPSFLSNEASDLLRRMLDTNPKNRATVHEVISHPWLRNRINPSSKISKRPLDISCGLDENMFARVCESFPHSDPESIRNWIAQDFNYYSATYWLLQNKCLPRTPAIRRTPIVGNVRRQTPNSKVLTPTKQQQQHHQQRQSSPMKKARFATVRASPQNPRLQKLHAISIMMSNNNTSNHKNNNNCSGKVKMDIGSAKSKLSPFVKKSTPKKSIVKRLLWF